MITLEERPPALPVPRGSRERAMFGLVSAYIAHPG